MKSSILNIPSFIKLKLISTLFNSKIYPALESSSIVYLSTYSCSNKIVGNKHKYPESFGIPVKTLSFCSSK